MTRGSWPVLLLAALLVAGCDVIGAPKLTPQPKPLSHARFVRAANRACARATRRVRAIKKPTNALAVLADLRRFVVPRYERLLFVLRGLAPPPADAVAFRRMLTTFNDFDQVVHHALDAVDARQIPQAKRLARHLDLVGRRIHLRAKKLGLRICARV
jgi:hypothetical protein